MGGMYSGLKGVGGEYEVMEGMEWGFFYLFIPLVTPISISIYISASKVRSGDDGCIYLALVT